MICWTIAAAIAAAPIPDRGWASRSGALVADDTLEVGLGTFLGTSSSVPFVIKYSADGRFEPRIAADLSGITGGSPGVSAGAKIRLAEAERSALALWVGSSVPLGEREIWEGSLGLLLDARVGREVGLGLDAGLRLLGAPGPVVVDVPLIGRVSWRPASRVLWSAELSTRAGGSGCGGTGCLPDPAAIRAGVGLSLTEQLAIDGGIGWALSESSPFGILGLTANLGRLR